MSSHIRRPNSMKARVIFVLPSAATPANCTELERTGTQTNPELSYLTEEAVAVLCDM